MFGDLLGNMQEKQKEIKARLAEHKVSASSGDGAITVEANANKEILNISIDPQKIDFEDTEQLEDLLLVALNRTLELAKKKEQEESQKMIKDMMPPGLGGLGNLFG